MSASDHKQVNLLYMVVHSTLSIFHITIKSGNSAVVHIQLPDLCQ